MVKLAGAVPRAVLASDATGFKLTPALLEAALTPRTKLVILNSPSNPTGAVYTRAELEALTAIALKRNLYILSDEIYEHLIYDGAQPTCLATLGPDAAARTIVVSGFSKTYSMTGWRLGTLVAAAPIAKAVAELQSQMTSNATTFGQYGALAALREKDKARAALACSRRSTAAGSSCTPSSIKSPASPVCSHRAHFIFSRTSRSSVSRTRTSAHACSKRKKWPPFPAAPLAPRATCASAMPPATKSSARALRGWRNSAPS
jgi:aspartate/methionine/tyrosine aminotransferase